MQLLNDILAYKKWNKILPVLVFFFGIWYFCLGVLGHKLDFIPGDLGDSRFINFLLENGHLWITGQTSEFWNASFMYPHKSVIAISDNMIGTMPFYSVWRILGFSFETSYQLWWIVICSLNFWSAYFVVKKWFSRWDLAIIVAWIFAFTIFNMGQLNYMQMIIRFMVPITFYAAAKMVETSSIKYFVIFSFAIVYQFYSVIYTGFFLMYFSFGFTIIYALIHKKPLFFIPFFKLKNLFYLILTLSISIGAMMKLITPYLQMVEQVGYHTYDEIITNLPTFKTYLYPHRSSRPWLFLHLNFQPNVKFQWMHYTFPGMIPLLALFSIPFYWVYKLLKKSSISSLTLSLTIFMFILFLLYIRTSDGVSLYKYIFDLPGMNSIRVMNRYWHVALFIILIAIVSVIKNNSKKWNFLIFILVFIDNSYNPSYIVKELKVELAERRLNSIRLIKNNWEETYDAFVFMDRNETQPSHVTQLDGMISGQQLSIPTVNGYSSSCPGEFSFFFGYLYDDNLNRWLKWNSIDSSKILII